MPLPMFDPKKFVGLIVSKRKKDGALDGAEEIVKPLTEVVINNTEVKKGKTKRIVNFVKEARKRKKEAK